MKRYCTILLVVVMLCSLVACNQTENTPASIGSSVSMQTPPNSKPSTPTTQGSEASTPPTQGNEAILPPTTQGGETTEPPATQATNPPVTQPSATTPPVTQPPATQPPATQPSVTNPPTTTPTTEPPVIEPPETEPVTPKITWTFTDKDINYIEGTNGKDTVTIKVGHPELPDNYLEGTLEIKRSQFCCDGEWVFYREYCYYEYSEDPTPGIDIGGGGRHRSFAYYMVRLDGNNKEEIGSAYNGYDGPIRVSELIGIENNILYFLAAEGMPEMGTHRIYIYKAPISEYLQDIIVQGTMLIEIEDFRYDVIGDHVEEGWIYYKLDNSYEWRDPHHLCYKMRIDGTDNQFVEKITVKYREW